MATELLPMLDTSVNKLAPVVHYLDNGLLTEAGYCPP